MSNAPIALFCFNRLEHLQKTVGALQANFLAAESDLFLFCDGPRSDKDLESISKVREFARNVSGFRAVEVIEQPKNLGLANSIISGVTQLVKQFGRVIVVEDDLVTSPYFLNYLNDGLEMYKNDETVASIHAWTPPISSATEDSFFLRGADCWGWATWDRAWAHFEGDGKKLLNELEERNLTFKFDLDGAYGYTNMLRAQIEGKNNSWAVRWHASAFLQNMLTLYPRVSLVENIGLDGTGTHCSPSDDYKVGISVLPVKLIRIPLKENLALRAKIAKFYGVKKSLGSFMLKPAHALARVLRGFFTKFLF